MASLTFSFPFVYAFSPSGTSLLHGVMWGSSLLFPQVVSHIPHTAPPELWEACDYPVSPRPACSFIGTMLACHFFYV